jgi:hypothetical protein
MIHYPTHMLWLNPKPKRKYKTKKEKGKDVLTEELAMVTQTTVGEELCDEEVQSLRDLVEEVDTTCSMKSKKKKTWQMKRAQSKQRPMKGLLPLLSKGREYMR